MGTWFLFNTVFVVFFILYLMTASNAKRMLMYSVAADHIKAKRLKLFSKVYLFIWITSLIAMILSLF